MKLLVAIIAFSFAFIGCSDDDDPVPDDKPNDVTIPIDDNSAFNMKNFVMSFEQLFMSRELWAVDFDHVYDDGNATMTYQNYKIYGKFGMKFFTLTHTYNDMGVIISTERSASIFEDDIVVFTYEYDIEGFITKLTKKSNNEIRDIVSLAYNADGMLLTKTHMSTMKKESWTETFTYNSEGMVASWVTSRGEKEEWTYSGGNMVESKSYENNVLYRTTIYEYDSDGRLIKETESGDNNEYATFEYTTDMLIVREFEDGMLSYMMEIGVGITEHKSYEFYYTVGGTFDYCRAKEDDTDGNTSKKYYYEGTVDNLVLVGYSEIDSRDASKDDKKTMESVYNASGTKLYYAEFTISGSADSYWYISETNWFMANGTAINEMDIAEDWVFVLVR